MRAAAWMPSPPGPRLMSMSTRSGCVRCAISMACTRRCGEADHFVAKPPRACAEGSARTTLSSSTARIRTLPPSGVGALPSKAESSTGGAGSGSSVGPPRTVPARGSQRMSEAR